MSEDAMILIAPVVLAVIAFAVYIKTISAKQANQSDDQRTFELLRRSRLMFPSAENDIFALDAMYEHTYRELLVTQKEGTSGWETLRHDLILIVNAKNRAIDESARFEARYIKILPALHASASLED